MAKERAVSSGLVSGTSAARAKQLTKPGAHHDIEIKLVVVAGQSNCAGYDTRAEDLVPAPMDKEILFTFDVGSTPAFDNGHHNASSYGQWTTLRAQPNGVPDAPTGAGQPASYAFRTKTGGFGPEISIARTLYAGGLTNLAVLKFAFGSSCFVARHWNPGDELHRAFMSRYIHAVKALQDQGYAPRVIAVFWHQGESDTGNAEFPAQFMEFVNDFRRHSGNAFLSFITAVSTPEYWLWSGEVTEKELQNRDRGVGAVHAAIAKQNPNIHYVDDRGCQRSEICGHYSSEGTLEIGNRMGKKYLEAYGSYPAAAPARYEGKFCAGEGDDEFLRLIDESFAFFHPNPAVPNLAMLYKPEWDTFEEGAGWGAWWIQNSYGFSYAATPFLSEPWFSALQRSWDLFWDNQGDGKRMGLWGGKPDSNPPLSSLVGPDGCLGDTAAPGWIHFKQGDGDVNRHDWFYEATAAGVVMQAEILLASRDRKALAHYLPKMARACDCIERTRDPKNHLFLVGPACNLLAPSYGGVRQPDGAFGKGYLAGLSITYLAALDRMVELCEFADDKEKLAEYKRRQKITRESLPQLLAPAGYFVKSIEPGGIKHGVLGQKQFGYLEGVANADAVALRVVDDQAADRIYKQIAAFPEIRPCDFLLTNAPGLDDTYWSWGNTTGPGMEYIHNFGDWVNGGVWGTVEGRAILMYYRLGKFEDIRRSAARAMKWAKDFRMDAPWSQRGENTDNPWSDSGQFHIGGVAVMVDNFAIPAATVRGLFDYEYRSDRLILRPRVPGSITQYTQKEPVRFGGKRLFLSCRNDGPKIAAITVNGKAMKVNSPDALVLVYDELPTEANIEITTAGGWPQDPPTTNYPTLPSLVPGKDREWATPAELPESLKRPFAVLSALKELIDGETCADHERAFVSATLEACEARRMRTAMDPGPGYCRPITPGRKAAIGKFYEDAALRMYGGFAARMARYAEKGDARQKRLASLFAEAQRP